MAGTAKHIIVGDVGGTNVRLAIARVCDQRIELKTLWKQPGEQYATFMTALDAFVGQTLASEGASRVETATGGGVGGEAEGWPVAGAAIGLAGPVSGGRVRLLHRDWTVDAGEIGARLGSDAVVLVNDFVAMARSAPELDDADMIELSPGHGDVDANIVVGGPGTGFGLGVLKRMRTKDCQSGWVVVGGEGGHQLFAPQSDLEWKVALRLREQGVYVSNEVIASGSGFEQTLGALADVMGVTVETSDPGEIIARAKAGDPLTLEMCRLRARATMSALGDAALAANATGGVYVAGGVAAHIRQWLVEDEAIARFRDRGPRSELLANIPIRLITGDRAALVGAAALWRDQQERGWI